MEKKVFERPVCMEPKTLQMYLFLPLFCWFYSWLTVHYMMAVAPTALWHSLIPWGVSEDGGWHPDCTLELILLLMIMVNCDLCFTTVFRFDFLFHAIIYNIMYQGFLLLYENNSIKTIKSQFLYFYICPIVRNFRLSLELGTTLYKDAV